MLNPQRVLPHSLIYDRVWGYDFGPPRTRCACMWAICAASWSRRARAR